MITKYKTSHILSPAIEKVEILRETKGFVFIKYEGIFKKNLERREAKRSEYTEYHDTWKDAHRSLMSKAKGKVNDAERLLYHARKTMKTIQDMKDPQ